MLADSCLGRALAVSLALHGAVIGVLLMLDAPMPRSLRAQPDLTVSLREPPPAPIVAPVASPPLQLPKPAPVKPRPAVTDAPAVLAKAGPPRASAPSMLSGEAARKAIEQLQQELLYPQEAIERGLQGEALVLLFLDRSGNAIAARLEASSGHALLDDAAVRAARTLRSLPDSAPREALLPVRFRLR